MPGQAEGPTAITLDDGTSWYWYHQSVHECDNNPVIDELGIRAGQIHYRYPENYPDSWTYEEKKKHSYNWYTACSSYTINTVLANLLGRDYSVWDLWKDLDVPPPFRSSMWDGEYTVDMLSSVNGTGRDLLHNVEVLRSKLCPKYPYLKMEDLLNKDRDYIDALMDDPDYTTMITFCCHNNSYCTSKGHYVVLFRKKGDRYGVLTSSSIPVGTEHEVFIKVSSRWMTWEELTENVTCWATSFSMDNRYYEHG